jgi:hypothetical protein
MSETLRLPPEIVALVNSAFDAARAQAATVGPGFELTAENCGPEVWGRIQAHFAEVTSDRCRLIGLGACGEACPSEYRRARYEPPYCGTPCVSCH